MSAAQPPSLRTLPECRRFFFGKATPRLILPAIVLVTLLRVRYGEWGWGDLLVPAGILALEPFTEWVIHVAILHFRPRRLGPIPIDFHAARKHRFHHEHPNDPQTSFVPLVDLVGLGSIVAVVLYLLAPTTGAFLSGVLVALSMLLVYEWSHFLIHTPYQPSGRYYRSIWRAHRLHHFKNEHYWYGVTVTLGDRLLGTFPDKSEVTNSPTARKLHAPAG